MKIIVSLLLFVALAPVLADGPEREMGRHHCREAGGPYLGLHTTRMEKATAAQLKGVPQGVGLLVKGVVSHSPASQAGLQPLDVLWKYDDQLVVNEGQLHALIKLTGIGNQGALTVSRGGENLVLPVLIGPRPDNRTELAAAASEVLMPPLPGAIVRQLDLGKRSGFISEGGVTVSLARNLNGFEYSVTEGSEVVREGVLQGQNDESWPATIDEKTRRKLEVLFQSLENAEKREASAQRLPRVRRVPVPKRTEEK